MKRSMTICLMIIFTGLCTYGVANAEERKKVSWYIGFGLGSGTLNFEGSSLESYLEDRSYSGWAEYYNVKEEDETTTFHIAVGSVVNPKIHLEIGRASCRERV